MSPSAMPTRRPCSDWSARAVLSRMLAPRATASKDFVLVQSAGGALSIEAGPMKAAFLTLILALTTANASAASCTMTAEEKKLAGAAKTSFMKKCETDAATACGAAAADKKLSGAAKNSFVKKCVKDATK